MELKNMQVIVTGGASGIGRATALMLADRGARVIVGDVDREGGETLAKESASASRDIRFHHLDLTDAASARQFVDAAVKAGPIGGLVNAAGWDRVEPFMENDPELWRKLIDINLLGPIRLTRHVLDSMTQQKAGRIVNISSDAGRVGSMGETVYSACKGGVIAFTKALAREMARYQINVNCICPGPTNTPLLHAQTSDWAIRIREGMTRAVPFRRLAEPQEIAEGIVYFLSPASAFVTGQVLSVSGGLTMAG